MVKNFSHEERTGRIVGICTRNGKHLYATSAERRFRKDIRLTNTGAFPDLIPGQVLLLDITENKAYSYHAVASILAILGQQDDPSTYSLIAVHNSAIPEEFSREALHEAAAATAAPMTGREDLRQIPLITIDGEDARDFDDAVYAAPYHSEKYGDGWHLIVAIADVAHYVTPGSALDNEAAMRGNSVYFPDRVVPMLPEVLSNDWCSLRPGVDRAALVVHLWIDRYGTKHRHRFCRAMIRSAARCTYHEVQNSLDTSAVHPLFTPLYNAYAALRKAREERGALELNSYEHMIHFGIGHEVTGIALRPSFTAHKIIEEFMVLANVAAAETLTHQNIPTLYRVHPAPPPERLTTLRSTLKPAGLTPKFTGGATPKAFNTLLDKNVGTPLERLVQQATLQAQAQASYTPVNQGHFGLGLAQYCHFTSPIRRYADLVVHRALLAHLKEPEADVRPHETLAQLGQHLCTTERRAATAERDAKARFIARYYARHLGTSVQAVVWRVMPAGLLVLILDTSAEAFLPKDFLGRDTYRFDEKTQTLKAMRRGQVFRLGEVLTCTVGRVDVMTGSVQVSLVQAHGSDAAVRRKKKGKATTKKQQMRKRNG
ncbi:MAG: ribonuclease R family protein [Holosporales bacterium]|jgi:ribonuclease R